MIMTGASRLATDRPVRLTALAGNGVGRHSLSFEIGSLKILIDPGSYSNGAANKLKKFAAEGAFKVSVSVLGLGEQFSL